jgi:hypothetical protein
MPPHISVNQNKKIKMKLIFNQKLYDNFYNIIIFIPLLSFITGFYLNENSAGMGDYAGDINWIKKNIQIFLQNDLRDAIFHPDLFGNRPPLIYIINKLLNPFFNDFEKYRLIVFLISLIGPIIFYQSLKMRFNLIDKKILFLVSSLIYLSPYYRTSGFWGLNENYGIFTMFITFFFLEKFNLEEKKFTNTLALLIFSSLTVYFDQKFLFVPIVTFFSIMYSKNTLRNKLFVTIGYFILSVPYLYLLYRWNGIVPPATQLSNPKTITSISDLKFIYHIHAGYAATLISFYLLPIVLFTNSDLFKKIKGYFFLKKTYFYLILFLLFNFYNLFYFNFEQFTVTDYWVGLGVVHKLSLIATDQLFFQEILTYVFFFFSFIVLLFYFYENSYDGALISYFIFISLLLWPLMQEYFDPTILIIAFSLFKSVKNFNRINSLIVFSYFSVFLLIANLHYS